MPHRSRWLAAPLVAGLLLAACSSGGSSAAPSSTAPAGGPAQAHATVTSSPVLAAADRPGGWTVFVYMSGDNNLEPSALADLQEMGRATGTRFVVLLDRIAGYSNDDLLGLGSFTDSVVLDIRDGQARVVATPGETDMGDPATLASFIGGFVPQYRSDHNALVVWDHGGAWQGAAYDDTSKDKLTVPEIASGLRAGLQTAGADRFDVIGFDACLMATYEVADALSPYGAYLLASEETEPGNGWDWTSLSTAPAGVGARDLAEQVMSAYNRSTEASGDTGTTISLIDLTALPALDRAASQLAAAMNDDGRSVVGRIGYGRNQALSFGRSPDPRNDLFSVDLATLASQLADVPGMADAASGMADAVQHVVVATDNGSASADAGGIAAYFPPTRSVVDKEYGPQRLASAWSGVLDAFYGSAAAVRQAELPTFTDPDRYIEDADAPSDLDGVRMSAGLERGTGGNVVSADLLWGEVSPADTSWVVWFGQSNARVSGDTVSADYDWRYLTISDGTTTANGYSSLTYGPDGVLHAMDVPVRYTSTDGTAEGVLQLLIDPKGRVTSESFVLDAGGVTASVPPQPGDTFMPLLRRQNLQTGQIEWVPATGTPLSARLAGLHYRYDTLPGAVGIMVGLAIEDVAGNHDYVFHGTATPAELG